MVRPLAYGPSGRGTRRPEPREGRSVAGDGTDPNPPGHRLIRRGSIGPKIQPRSGSGIRASSSRGSNRRSREIENGGWQAEDRKRTHREWKIEWGKIESGKIEQELRIRKIRATGFCFLRVRLSVTRQPADRA